MMGAEQNATYYDKAWQKWSPTTSTERSRLYLKAADWCARRESVLDVGCGPGLVAQILSGWSWPGHYSGIDFSTEAIRIAKARDLDPHRFEFRHEDAAIVTYIDRPLLAIEFLEHVSFDVDFLRTVERGTPIALSVPSFDDPGHVRFFPTFDDVFRRYGPELDIDYATTLSAPMPGHRWYWLEGFKK